MSSKNIAFQAEVSSLLDIVINSLYSNKEIFLRELISNSSDACDKLRYTNLANNSDQNVDFKINIHIKDKQIIIDDNGIGMNYDDLLNNLGTIAKSGAKNFLESLNKKNDEKVEDLIGRFGVGFYSVFMVAGNVEVVTKKYQDTKAWKWISDGKSSFTIDETTKESHGTKIIINLHKDCHEYADEVRIKHLIKTYSNYVSIPIVLHKLDKDNKPEEEILNETTALWKRPKSQITQDDYDNFYNNISNNFDKPLKTIHFNVEGKIEYTALLFIPQEQPMDLFNPSRKHSIKVFSNKVFISEDCSDILPPWLRFVKGIVDSSDLPLNVSREMLQKDLILQKIRNGLIKKVLSAIKEMMKKDKNAYEQFCKNFLTVLKEGLCEVHEYNKDILDLCSFYTTKHDNLVDLETYTSAMPKDQKKIYFINGNSSINTLKFNPQIEAYEKKGIEVLLLNDSIDEFWTTLSVKFKEFEFKSVSQEQPEELNKITGTDKAEDKKEQEAKNKKLEPLIKFMQQKLDDRISEIILSERLTNSACCFAIEEQAIPPHLEKLMQQRSGKSAEIKKRKLEINSDHEIIQKMLHNMDSDIAVVEKLSNLLFYQASIQDGEIPENPTQYSAMMWDVIAK